MKDEKHDELSARNLVRALSLFHALETNFKQGHLTGRFSNLFVQNTFYNPLRFSWKNYHLVFSWNEKFLCCFWIDTDVVLLS